MRAAARWALLVLLVLALVAALAAQGLSTRTTGREQNAIGIRGEGAVRRLAPDPDVERVATRLSGARARPQDRAHLRRRSGPNVDAADRRRPPPPSRPCHLLRRRQQGGAPPGTLGAPLPRRLRDRQPHVHARRPRRRADVGAQARLGCSSSGSWCCSFAHGATGGSSAAVPWRRRSSRRCRS